VGPTIAAPACMGCAVKKDWSFSLASTPGYINTSAMFYELILFINIAKALKNAVRL